MKKILIGKQDDVDDIAAKIKRENDSTLVLVVPKSSHGAARPENLALLKEEAQAAGKTLFVESVDEVVLAAARESNIESIHPFFQPGQRKGTFSDIVAVSPPRQTSPTSSQSAPHRARTVREEIVQERQDIVSSEPEETQTGSRWIWGIGAAGVLAVVAVGVLHFFFSSVNVDLRFKTFSSSQTVALIADTTTQSVDVSRGVIPAELFSQQKNVTQLFKASGHMDVSERATGKILISNGYSSKPQPLVATSRFQTSQGKIFRLVSAVVVPGAQVHDGKIIPATIESDVVADAPGPTFNITQETQLTIPGFKGSPKYAAFSGIIRSTAGGFVGNKAVVSENDIALARQKTADLLTDSLKAATLAGKTDDFTLLDSTSHIEVTKLTVNTSTDVEGNFSVFAEGRLHSVGFRDTDVRSILLARAQAEVLKTTEPVPPLHLKEMEVNYTLASSSSTTDTKLLQFVATARVLLTPAFSPDNFSRLIQGKSIQDARSAIAAIAGLAEAKVSVWPFWRTSIPTRQSAIHINTQ